MFIGGRGGHVPSRRAHLNLYRSGELAVVADLSPGWFAGLYAVPDSPKI